MGGGSLVVIFTVTFFGLVYGAAKPPVALPLPPYIKGSCSRNDPDFDNCVVKVGAPVIKVVAKGDPKYRIPSLDPLLIEEFRLKEGAGSVALELVCKNCKLWGIQNAEFYKCRADWKKRTASWFVKMKELKLTGIYNVTGKILLLPIFGNGDFLANIKNLDLEYKYSWDYEKKSNGKIYGVPRNGSFIFDVGQLSLRLENLFNGDKFLGENMNQLINDEWRKILDDMRPALSRTFGQIADQIFANMAKLIPLDTMFPEKYTPPKKN